MNGRTNLFKPSYVRSPAHLRPFARCAPAHLRPSAHLCALHRSALLSIPQLCDPLGLRDNPHALGRLPMHFTPRVRCQYTCRVP